MKTKKPKYLMYRILRFFIKPVYLLLYRPKIINKDLIPSEGPIIVCGNHYHAFDQFNVMFATKRILHYLAKKEYFDGVHSLFGKPSKLGNAITCWLVKNAKMVIRVDRSAKDDNAKSAAIEVLNEGKALGIFPEGTRNDKIDPPPFLLPFKFGTVSMAQKTGAIIVPFAATGEYKIFKKNHLNIRFGTPFTVPKDMDLEEANDKLFEIVSDLKRAGLEDIKNGKC